MIFWIFLLAKQLCTISWYSLFFLHLWIPFPASKLGIRIVKIKLHTTKPPYIVIKVTLWKMCGSYGNFNFLIFSWSWNVFHLNLLLMTSINHGNMPRNFKFQIRRVQFRHPSFILSFSEIFTIILWTVLLPNQIRLAYNITEKKLNCVLKGSILGFIVVLLHKILHYPND